MPPLHATGGGAFFIPWLLVTYGITLVITGSKIARPVRNVFPALLACPMCTGWWVGLGLSLLGLGVVDGPWWAVHFENAFASSGACWTMHVVLAKLGAEEL
jgi:hypothetical protein